jgi:predicted PurR-regulated permease PerM
MIFVLVVLAVIALMLANTATQFNQALPGYQERLNELSNEMFVWLRLKGVNINKAGILDLLDPTQVITFANAFVAGIAESLKNTILILFMVIFMLIETMAFPRKIRAIKNKNVTTVLIPLRKIFDNIRLYAGTKSVVSLITGILIWLALEIIGLDFAPVWGFLAFVLNFIPNIGSILAAIPAVMLAILKLDPVMVLIVMGVYFLVNMIMGNVIETKIMGQRLGLSMLAVFISLLFWGWMFGAVGMLLSVPLTMVVKFIAQIHPQTQWLDVLLSPAPAITASDNEKMN